MICASQNISQGRFLSLQYIILANLFPSLANPTPFSFILVMNYLTKKIKMISPTLSIIFPSVITNRKHGESIICNPEIEGKEPAKWQRDVSCFLIKKDEKACHISKRECYIIIINSERKEKTPPPEKNIINSRADQRREPGFILNWFLPVPSSFKFIVYLNYQDKAVQFYIIFQL